jgi:uncharacterized protein YndB with AHSA1/START domain
MSNYLNCNVIVNSSIEKVWDYFTNSSHIVNWNFASDDWHCPSAVNDFKVGGKFSFRMEAKDKSFGFDLEGIYSFVDFNNQIDYSLADGRKVSVTFDINNDGVALTELFEPENQNPFDLQQQGWQSILNNFKSYTELY